MKKVIISAGVACVTLVVALAQNGLIGNLLNVADRAATIGCFFGLGDVQKPEKIKNRRAEYLKG